MRKIAKKLLALLLASVMMFGLLPISERAGIDFGNMFTVTAHAATVSSRLETDSGWIVRIPANTKVQCYQTETSTVNYRKIDPQTTAFNLYCDKKITLSDGSVRYYFVSAEGYGLYFVYSNSYSARPNPNVSALGYSSNGISCSKPVEMDISTTEEQAYCTVKIYNKSNNATIHSETFYLADTHDFVWMPKLSLTQTVTYGMSITLYVIFDDGTKISNVVSDIDITVAPCQQSTPYGVSYDANGGTGAPARQQWSNLHQGTDALSSVVPTKNGYKFLYWEDVNSTGSTYSPGQSVSYDHNNLSLRAVWKKNDTYAVSYNANGGSGAPAAQTKQYDVNLALSTTVPTKKYTVSYNANGGNVSPTSKTVSCTFKNWNTAQNGSGTAYKPGATYSANQDLMLYAQWTNPTYGTLPTPARAGYTFSGWYTSATGGTKITSSNTVSSNTTLYAQWKAEDIYNLGEETYSFANFGDNDSAGGHCFGMSITSSGYYIGALDVSEIGLSSADELYTVTLTEEVKEPICHYQAIQGSDRQNAIVAGGKPFRTPYFDMESDWTEVVNYVKNHNHDNKGTLQVLNYVDGEGGHAMNFLYYSNVSGQDRIYVYDNNYPNTETYFYKDSYGEIRQYPESTFKNALDSIGLLDVKKYLQSAEDFDFTHVIYAYEGEVSIDGAEGYPMFGETGDRIKYMYEVPENLNEVKIIPLVDNAEFSYLNEEYSFGKVDDTTVGVFKLATLNSDADTQAPGLTIENENKSIWDIILDFFKMLLGLIMLPFSFLF